MTQPLFGFSIPFRINDSANGGGVASASDAEKLKENIVHILLTNNGERVMRPDYGGGLRQLVHDPNNDVLRAIVQHQISQSISRWEPRVQIQDVIITQQAEQGRLTAELNYVIRETQQPQSVSIPLGIGGI